MRAAVRPLAPLPRTKFRLVAIGQITKKKKDFNVQVSNHFCSITFFLSVIFVFPLIFALDSALIALVVAFLLPRPSHFLLSYDYLSQNTMVSILN